MPPGQPGKPRKRILKLERAYTIHKCKHAGFKKAERPCCYCEKIYNSQHSHRNHLCPPPSERKDDRARCPGVHRNLTNNEWILLFKHYQGHSKIMPIFEGVFKGCLTSKEKEQMKITKAQLEQMGEYEGDSTSKQTHHQTRVKRGIKRSLLKSGLKKVRPVKRLKHVKKESKAIAFEHAKVGPLFDNLRCKPFNKTELDSLYADLNAHANRATFRRTLRKVRHLDRRFIQGVRSRMENGAKEEALVLMRWEKSYDDSKKDFDWEEKAFVKQNFDSDIVSVMTPTEVFDKILELIQNQENLEGEKKSSPKAFEVKQIIGKRKVKGKVQYLVSWKGYGPEDNSWEPVANLHSARDAIKAFNVENPVIKKVKIEKGQPAQAPVAFPNAMVGTEYAKLQCKAFNQKELNKLYAEIQARASRKRHGSKTRNSKRDAEFSMKFAERVDFFMNKEMKNEALVLLRWGVFWYQKQLTKGDHFRINHIAPIQLDKAFGKVPINDDDVKVMPDVFPVIDDVIDLTNEVHLNLSGFVKVRVKEEQCG